MRGFRERYRAFTVDEYQDVNGLQQRLLELWLGGRDDLCAVGDDYQSIYGFTGAGPEHLLAVLALRRRSSGWSANYRSTEQVLAAREPARASARRRREDASSDGLVREQPELAASRPGLRRPTASWRGSARSMQQASRTRNRPSSSARTHARPTSRSSCTRRTSPSRARRYSRAKARERCSGACRGRAVPPALQSVQRRSRSAGSRRPPTISASVSRRARATSAGSSRSRSQLEDVSELAPELERRFGASVANGVHLLDAASRRKGSNGTPSSCRG